MNRAAEYCSDNDPQECGGAEHNAHDSAENRAKTGDIKKLNQKHFPRRKRNKIHPVTTRLGGNRTFRIDPEDSGA